MKLRFMTYMFLFSLCASVQAFAGECTVKNADVFARGGLQEQIVRALRGACLSTDSNYQDRYNSYYPGETRFHVIRFQTDMQLVASRELDILRNTMDEPIVITAGDKRVVFDGNEAIRNAFILEGKKIVLDGLVLESFQSNALEIKGEEHLLLQNKIWKNAHNGIVVRGSNHVLSANEIASNALNGIVVESDDQYDCLASVETKDQNISLRGNFIHHNGSGEKSCSFSSGQLDSACAMLAAEGKHCARLLSRSCDDDSAESCKLLRFRQNLCHEDLGEVSFPVSEVEASQILFERNPQASSGSGVLVHADGVRFSAERKNGQHLLNKISHNQNAGVYFANAKSNLFCNELVLPTVNMIRTVEIGGTGFSLNGEKRAETSSGRYDLLFSRFPLPGVKSLVGTTEGDENTLSISGYLLLPSDPFHPFSSTYVSNEDLKVEIFSSSQNGSLIQSLGRVSVSPENGRFFLSVSNGELPQSLRAIVQSTYYQHSSELSPVSLLGMSIDTDGDGLSNDEEDKNGNGKIERGEGETDPLNPDTDGDGLTDAEEVKKTGRVEAYLLSHSLRNPRALDPNNPDSDGDCLPDGLELGVGKEEVMELVHLAPVNNSLKLSSACFEQLQEANIEMTNVIPVDANTEGESLPQSLNIAFLYDEDVQSQTDPTASDTDGDGVLDGEEDWDLNGSVSLDLETQQARETDPLNVDSDNDGILDGDEGDINRNGEIGDRESSGLQYDTDGDGVPDGIEQIAGTKVNDCDSDGDGLSDGVEMGYKGGGDFSTLCHGLSDGGTNYTFPQRLDPLNPDSDGDGIVDGEEDKNGNGWIEDDDSDPSNEDTDHDGIDDGIELHLDFNRDGYPDFELASLVTEGGCTPSSASDIDCDSIPNYLDADSDSDGCPDKDEQISDVNNNDIPDIYDAQMKQCGKSSAGASAASLGSVVSQGRQTATADKTEAAPQALNNFYIPHSSGGTCALVISSSLDRSQALFLVFFLLLPLVAVKFLCYKRQT